MKTIVFFNKKLKYFFYFFWIISLFFLSYKIQQDVYKYRTLIKIDFKNFFYIFFFFILILNISSYRFFYFFKKLTKYSSNYLNWSSLFFQTVIMNLFFQGSGHLLRAIELKKKNVNYSQFLSINYVFLLLILFVNFFLFMCFFFFISKKKIILLSFFIFLVFVLILINKEFYKYLIIFLNKKIKFIKNKYKDAIESFLFNCSIFFLKKNLLIFLLFTLVIFYLEFISFYLLVSNIFSIKNIYSISLIFIIVFYLNKVPFLINIFGLNEIIVGLFAESLGFQFAQGSLIQFIYRIFLYISAIFSSILYFSLNFKKSS
jgi:hypothetical protein